jgi:hypothetical protein
MVNVTIAAVLQVDQSFPLHLDTLFEQDIITAHHKIQHGQEALKANRFSSASFGLPVVLLLFVTGFNSVQVAETNIRLEMVTGGIEWKQRTFVR